MGLGDTSVEWGPTEPAPDARCRARRGDWPADAENDWRERSLPQTALHPTILPPPLRQNPCSERQKIYHTD
jgi:hypothetical protein